MADGFFMIAASHGVGDGSHGHRASGSFASSQEHCTLVLNADLRKLQAIASDSRSKSAQPPRPWRSGFENL
jgi:hypothetical protein